MTRAGKNRSPAASPGRDAARPSMTGLLWKGALILILSGALVVLALDLPGRRGGDDDAASDGSATQSASPTSPQSSLPSGVAPEPWFYDEANDQHWHPDHGHWHPGPPPPPGQRQPTIQQVPPAAPQSSLPSGVTPEPWFYDEANDQHWHPDHGHWHPGPPPPPGQRQPTIQQVPPAAPQSSLPSGVTPEP